MARPARPTVRRGASKRQQNQLSGLSDRLAATSGRIQLAELVSREASTLVSADTSAFVVQSIQGARVLAASPEAANDPEVWGIRTLAALLSRREPVRMVLDGDPLAGGGRTALLTVPIPAGGRSVGVLICRRRSPRGFTNADEDALLRMARACGDRLHRTPERITVAASAVDRATGLGGHDLLRHDLAAALAAKPSHDLPISLVVAEVVGLARLRTGRGMTVADAALSAVAARVGRGLRVGDLLYRLSADEVAVLLPATDLDGGLAVADRLGRLDLSVPAASDEPVTAPSERGAAVPESFPGFSSEFSPGSSARLSLRAVAVPVEGELDGVLLGVARRLKALQIAERWAEPEVVQRSTI